MIQMSQSESLGDVEAETENMIPCIFVFGEEF